MKWSFYHFFMVFGDLLQNLSHRSIGLFNCFGYFNCFFNNLEYYNLTYHMDWRQTGVDIEAKLLWSEGISSKIWRNYDSVITTIWLPYEIKPSFPVNHGYKYGLTQCQDRPVKIFKGTEFDSSLFGLVRGPGKYELISNLIPEIPLCWFFGTKLWDFEPKSENSKIL